MSMLRSDRDREAVRHAGDRRVVGRICVISDAIRWNSAVRVWISTEGREGVAVVRFNDSSWSDATRRLTHRVLREGGRVDGREPDASLVDAVELGNQILKVDVVVRVVVEDQLLKIPGSRVSHMQQTAFGI